MKEAVRFGFILGLICVIAAGLLAGVNALTGPKILAQAGAEEEKSLKEIMPQADSFKQTENGYYMAQDKEGKLNGIAFKISAKGYSSTIEVMAGMLADGTITGIKVLSQDETPGLGSKVSDSEFTGRFKGKKDLSQVQAITGATISSRAVIEAVKLKAAEIKGILNR